MPSHLQLPPPRQLGSRRTPQVQGGPRPPSRNPRRHGERLAAELDRAVAPPPPDRQVDGVDPRRVFKLATSNRLADPADDLRKRGLRVLGESDDAVYFVVPRQETVDQLAAEAVAYAAGPDEEGAKGKGRTFFDNVEGIQAYGPGDRLKPGVTAPDAMGPDDEVVVDIAAWPSATTEEARTRVDDIERACGDDGVVLGRDYSPRTTVVRARVDRSALGRLLELAAVESVRAPLGPDIEPSEWLRAEVDTLAVPEPIDVVVGIIDDGVVNHPLLQGVLIDQRTFPNGHEFTGIGTHGSAVAGLAAYGQLDSVFQGLALPNPVRIAVAQVLQVTDNAGVETSSFPSNSPDHEVLREATTWLVNSCGARIICLSITEHSPFSGPHAGPLTETIDQLAREHDVVFVISTGNTIVRRTGETASGDHIFEDYPTYLFDREHRVAEPGVAATAVTVGSVSTSDAAASPDGTSRVDAHVVAKRGQLSPFTRTGPGIRDAVKPDFVDGGGSVVWSGGAANAVDMGTSVITLNSQLHVRGFRAIAGTSLAAPRAANAIARIASRYPDASANLLRSLAALSAGAPRPTPQFTEQEHTLRGGGYGVINADRGAESGGSRVVLVHDGEILTDTASIHAIPIPANFATASTRRRIRLAVAFDPPVRRERRDYLAGHVRLDLYRGISLDEVIDIHQEQVDPTDPTKLPSDRRRFLDKFSPKKTRLQTSTLQVHTWELSSSRSLRADDGDTCYLVVAHVSAQWTEVLGDTYDAQPYALAVELVDLENVEIDLYTAVRLQLEERARAQIRL